MTGTRNTGIMLIAVGGLIVGALVGGLVADAPRLDRAPKLEFLVPPATPVKLDPELVEGAENVGEAFTAVANAITPAVVRVQVEQSAPTLRLQDLLRRDGELEGLPPLVASGTGFLVSSDGTILTNNHVVQGAAHVLVTLYDKRVFEAEIVGRDPTTDIAVLRIRAQDLPAVRLGDSDAARVGEWVVAIGNPGFGGGGTLDFTVTTGIISAKGRPLNIIPEGLRADDPETAGYAIEDFIQTDAVINPGNSGGPLLNLRGEAIGMNTAIASTTGFHQGYAFAIPVNLVRRVVRDLLEYGTVHRALLGVTINDVSAEDAEVYGLPRISGVLIEDLAGESPARAAGMNRHDVIVSLDEEPVDHVGQLQRVVALRSPGETVQVGAIRYGQPLTFDVILAEAPLNEPEPPQVRRQVEPEPLLGLQLEDLDEQLARQFGVDVGGVIVLGVDLGSAASRKGIIEGDRILTIDRQKPADAAAARAMIDAAEPGQVLSFLVRGLEGKTRIANVRTP